MAYKYYNTGALLDYLINHFYEKNSKKEADCKQASQKSCL